MRLLLGMPSSGACGLGRETRSSTCRLQHACVQLFGKASSVRRQYTSLCPLSQGSCHRPRSRRVTMAARSSSGVSPGLPLSVSTRPTKSAWRCCRRCCTCSSCAWVAWRTDRASSCTVPSARRQPRRGSATSWKADAGGGLWFCAACSQGWERRATQWCSCWRVRWRSRNAGQFCGRCMARAARNSSLLLAWVTATAAAASSATVAMPEFAKSANSTSKTCPAPPGISGFSHIGCAGAPRPQRQRIWVHVFHLW